MSASEGTGQESSSSGVSLPSWLPRSRDGFETLVLGTIATWIVAGILDVTAGVVDSLLAIYGAINSSLRVLIDTVGLGGSVILSGPEIVLSVVDGVILSLASNAGVFGPLVIVLLWSVTVVLLLVSIRWMIRGLWLLYNAIPIL